MRVLDCCSWIPFSHSVSVLVLANYMDRSQAGETALTNVLWDSGLSLRLRCGLVQAASRYSQKREAGTMTQATPAQRIELIIRRYIEACNKADAEAIAACFRLDAVHYSPYTPKMSGAATIGSNFAKMVQELGRCWTVDQLLVDTERCAAVLEWTSFNREQRWILRGVDWFVFEPQTFLIQEVRPYLAVPVPPEVGHYELWDFDYAARGYPVRLPVDRTQ